MNANNALLLVAGGVALAFLAVFLLVRYFIDRRRERLARRLSGQDSGESDLLVHFEAARADRGPMARMDRGFDDMIRRSGVEMTPEQAVGLVALLGVAGATLLYLWREELWLGLLGLALGMAIPLITFLFLQGRYRRQLQDQIPDAFYLLARSIRAGLTLQQAIALVGNEGVKPLADEFKRCASQVELGMTVGGALKLAGDRIRLLDFDALVSTVMLHQQTGGNLALLLDRLAASARDRNQFRAHFRASTALARVGAIGIGAALPLLLLGYALFQPEHIQTFFTTAAGWAMLGVAVGLQALGVIWMYRLLRIDY